MKWSGTSEIKPTLNPQNQKVQKHTTKLMSFHDRHAQLTEWTAPPQADGYSATLKTLLADMKGWIFYLQLSFFI